jgi:protein TonB
MTAVAVHASHVGNESRLSWPRIGAWSGSFSLHLVILAMLLTPPVALQVARQIQKDPTVRFIIPEEKKPEPAMPEPIRKQVVAPVTHIKTPPVSAPPIIDVPNDMGRATPVVDAPPAIDTKPTAADAEPSAIAYGKQTRVPYPIESMRNREQGTVTLRVLVSAAGLVQAVEIEKTSGWPRLDRAARDAVKGWSFHPAIRNGVAQSAWALVPVTFNLQQL